MMCVCRINNKYYITLHCDKHVSSIFLYISQLRLCTRDQVVIWHVSEVRSSTSNFTFVAKTCHRRCRAMEPPHRPGMPASEGKQRNRAVANWVFAETPRRWIEIKFSVE